MRFKIFIIAPLALSTLTIASGFEDGTHYEFGEYKATIRVLCYGKDRFRDAVTVDCSESIMSPATKSRFVDSTKNANTVYIENQTESGKTLNKRVRFYSNEGHSAEINLGENFLFQRPLLEEGENKIRYELRNNRRVVKSGSFTVFFREHEDRHCRSGIVPTDDVNNCRTYPDTLCRQYLRKAKCE